MKLKLNVPTGERLARVILGLATAIGGALWALNGEILWGSLLSVSALGFAVTGLVGWCPVCAAVGRTLPEPEHKVSVGKL